MRRPGWQMRSSTRRNGSRAGASAARHGGLGASARRQGPACRGATFRCAGAPALRHMVVAFMTTAHAEPDLRLPVAPTL
jgi:hypothetical protein